MLLDIAGQRRLDVGVVYEALDFQRGHCRSRGVRADMLTLIRRWGDDWIALTGVRWWSGPAPTSTRWLT